MSEFLRVLSIQGSISPACLGGGTLAHAFISYVRENSEIVDRLASELRSRGIEVWLDRDDIKPGMYWKDARKEAIQEGHFHSVLF